MNFVSWNILPDWFDCHLDKIRELYNRKFYNKNLSLDDYIEIEYNQIE